MKDCCILHGRVCVMSSFLLFWFQIQIMNATSTFTSIDCLETNDIEANSSFDNVTQSLHCNQTSSLLTQAGSPLSTLTYVSFGLICAILILGLCGNLLTLTITIKFRNMLKDHDILITALAICDSAAVILTPFNSPDVYEVLGTDITAVTTIGCKLFLGVWLSLLISSSAITLLISIERFVAVWFPLRSRHLLTRKTILRSVCVSVVLSFLTFITLCILYCEIQDGLCYPNFDGSEYSTVLKQMPDTTVYNGFIAMPSVIVIMTMCILTPMTIGKLIRHMAIRRHLTTQENNSSDQARITMKLTAVAIAYLFLIGLPFMAGSLIGLTGINIHDVRILQSGLIFAVLINHSTNFFLYNVFDNDFRKKVVSLFGVRFTKAKSPNVTIELQEMKNG